MDVSLKQTLVALRAVFYSTLFIALWVWLAALMRRYDAALAVTLPEWLRPLGVVLAAAGAALAAGCVAVFAGRGHGTPAPFDAPRRFVAVGPYRYVRNPMYVGAIAVLVGGGFAVGSIAIVLLAAIFWVLTHLLVLLYEEPVLQARFGASYEQYKQQVRRWLPGMKRG
jgi:protein-S-isoprenylcysteine O-methyltransferase Ste14